MSVPRLTQLGRAVAESLDGVVFELTPDAARHALPTLAQLPAW